MVALLVLWHLGASLGGLGAVPTPVEVGSAVVLVIASDAVWEPLGITLAGWAISLVLAVVVGVAAGFPLGMNRIAYRMSVFSLDFLRTIPALVLVPLVVLLYGSGLQSTVLLAFFGAVWAVTMQAIYGAHDVDRVARDTFRSFRTRRRDTITLLLVPTALPYIATGIRLAAAICLLITISAQLVIPAGGMGEQILTSQLGGAVPEMYAYIFLCGVLGVAVNAGFRRLEALALAWHPSYRKRSAA
ncbi:ABC transporter permease subunit [Georgenia sp. EYE_87]|uniref:ABC transporter permease n=1 Tax=Georgenia sp. EYE_87 TaxID=2853448 RepID=UPI0020037158|nr:ABC transporter permease subunit [Georgenia sp. EYE_87]MCK6212104.1 ABC transporter permease subunit [Georgenia sp. EYE_87]